METHDSGCAAERLHTTLRGLQNPASPSYQQLAHSWLSPSLAPAPQRETQPGCFFYRASFVLGVLQGGTHGAEDQDAPAAKYTSLICKYVVRAGWLASRPAPFHKGDTEVFSLSIRVIGEPSVHFPRCWTSSHSGVFLSI